MAIPSWQRAQAARFPFEDAVAAVVRRLQEDGLLARRLAVTAKQIMALMNEEEHKKCGISY